MAIESSMFGGCRLTGEDADAFREQFLGEKPKKKRKSGPKRNAQNPPPKDKING